MGERAFKREVLRVKIENPDIGSFFIGLDPPKLIDQIKCDYSSNKYFILGIYFQLIKHSPFLETVGFAFKARIATVYTSY